VLGSEEAGFCWQVVPQVLELDWLEDTICERQFKWKNCFNVRLQMSSLVISLGCFQGAVGWFAISSVDFFVLLPCEDQSSML